MKRKVGELFNRPIVQGNENVLSSNEILVEQKGNTFSLKERVNGEIKEVSGGGGSASSVEYLDLTGLATLQLSYYTTSSQELHLKMTMQGQEIATVGPAAQLVSQGPSASSIYAKIDFDAPIIMVQGTMRQDIKVRDYILSKVSESELAAIPRITKEEFYIL